MPRREVSRWFLEGALIVFSVLIALVIDEAVEKRKMRIERLGAIERITQELESNAEILERWRERHGELSRRLGAIVADPDAPARDRLLVSGYFDLGVVFGGESFIDATLSSSAWEATRTKGLVSELSWSTVQRLADTYALQRIVSEHTVARFSELYFERETHRPEALDGTLIQFQLLVGELTAQEATLAHLYGEALAHLESLDS